MADETRDTDEVQNAGHKKSDGQEKFVDYQAFGVAMSALMHSKDGISDQSIAKNVYLGKGRARANYVRTIASAREGYTTTVEVVEAIADYLRLDVPYVDVPLPDKSRPILRGNISKNSTLRGERNAKGSTERE